MGMLEKRLINGIKHFEITLKYFMQKYRPGQTNLEFRQWVAQCGNLAIFQSLILLDFRRSKTDILTILEALNLTFRKISHLEMSKIQN